MILIILDIRRCHISCHRCGTHKNHEAILQLAGRQYLEKGGIQQVVEPLCPQLFMWLVSLLLVVSDQFHFLLPKLFSFPAQHYDSFYTQWIQRLDQLTISSYNFRSVLC